MDQARGPALRPGQAAPRARRGTTGELRGPDGRRRVSCFIPAKFDEVLLRRAITRNDKQPLDLDRLGSRQPLPAPPEAKPGQDTNRSTTGRPADRGAGQTGTSKSGDRIVLSGRVLDPDGKPLCGRRGLFHSARTLRVWVPHPRPPRRPEPTATSGPDGRFEILIDRAEWDDVRSIPDRFGPQVRTFPLVAATAPRYGPSWVLLAKPEARADVTLQLVKDEIPIEGRILDLEGRPVPGATVTTDEILATPGEDLTPVIRSSGRTRGRAGEVPGGVGRGAPSDAHDRP